MLAHSAHCREHGGAGGQAIVHQDDNTTFDVQGRTAIAIKKFATFHLALLTLEQRLQRLFVNVHHG
jgi:hypothetical protein